MLAVIEGDWRALQREWVTDRCSRSPGTSGFAKCDNAVARCRQRERVWLNVNGADSLPCRHRRHALWSSASRDGEDMGR